MHVVLELIVILVGIQIQNLHKYLDTRKIYAMIYLSNIFKKILQCLLLFQLPHQRYNISLIDIHELKSIRVIIAHLFPILSQNHFLWSYNTLVRFDTLLVGSIISHRKPSVASVVTRLIEESTDPLPSYLPYFKHCTALTDMESGTSDYTCLMRKCSNKQVGFIRRSYCRNLIYDIYGSHNI